jgi:hypothetical protein
VKPIAFQGKDEFPLHRVELFNWVISAILTFAVGLKFPFFIAKSVFIGCLIANISFLFLKKDLVNFLQGKLLQSGKVNKAKRIFYVKYYVRLAIIALILYVLISRRIAHPLGLLVGLSVVVLSISITVVSVVKKFYFNAKEE